MTSYEVAIFLKSVLPLVSETGVELVSRWLIERATAGQKPVDLALAPALDSLLENRGPPWIRVFRAVGELIRPENLPILTVTPAGQDVASLEWVSRLLAELAVAQPRATLILLVEAPTEASHIYLAANTSIRSRKGPAPCQSPRRGLDLSWIHSFDGRHLVATPPLGQARSRIGNLANPWSENPRDLGGLESGTRDAWWNPKI